MKLHNTFCTRIKQKCAKLITCKCVDRKYNEDSINY
jgi:hypothetical protein